MARFKINDKRIKGESEKSYTILTSGHGGVYISIPKSQLTDSVKIGGIKINEAKTDKCKIFVLKPWIFNKIEQDLKKMGQFDYVLLNK